MKKYLILLSVILSLFVSSAVFGVVKDESVATDEGYGVYRLGDLGFVIPDYLVKSEETSGAGDVISFALIEDEPIASLTLDRSKLDVIFGDNTHIENFYNSYIDFMLTEMDQDRFGELEEKGVTEKLTSHGYSCLMSTSSFTEGYMLKNACIFDSVNYDIHSITYLYPKKLDNTYVVSDFYKLIYTDPYAYTSSQKESNQNDTYEPSTSDYLDILGSYLDAWGSLSEGDYSGSLGHLGDALDKTNAIENGERYTPDQNYGSQQPYSGGATDNDVIIAYFDFLKELNAQNNK